MYVTPRAKNVWVGAKVYMLQNNLWGEWKMSNYVTKPKKTALISDGEDKLSMQEESKKLDIIDWIEKIKRTW